MVMFGPGDNNDVNVVAKAKARKPNTATELAAERQYQRYLAATRRYEDDS